MPGGLLCVEFGNVEEGLVGVECSLDPADDGVGAGVVAGQCECIQGIFGRVTFANFGAKLIDVPLGCCYAFEDVSKTAVGRVCPRDLGTKIEFDQVAF